LSSNRIARRADYAAWPQSQLRSPFRRYVYATPNMTTARWCLRELGSHAMMVSMRRLERLRRMAWLAWFSLAVLPAALCAQQLTAPKRIMVLYWYNMDFPANVTFEKAFRSVLHSAAAGTVEYYAEYLETDRF